MIDFGSGGSLNLNDIYGVLNVKRLVSSQGSITLGGINTVNIVSGGNVQAAQDVNINPRGNLLIDAAATITAGNNVAISNQGVSASVTSINGGIFAKALSIIGNSNNDTINIQRIDIPTYVFTGAGNDTVNVGSKQPNGNGSLSGIKNTLTLDGASQFDTLNIDDSGNTNNATGIITASTITGFGMSGSIKYSNFENMAFKLGTGTNNVTVNGTHTGTTTITGNTGINNFTVNSIGGATTINGGGGVTKLFTTLPLSPLGLLKLNGGTTSTGTGGLLGSGTGGTLGGLLGSGTGGTLGGLLI